MTRCGFGTVVARSPDRATHPLWHGLRTVPLRRPVVCGTPRCGTVSGPRCGTVSGPCHPLWHGLRTVPLAPLWHGLRTVPLRLTEGLPGIHLSSIGSGRPAV